MKPQTTSIMHTRFNFFCAFLTILYSGNVLSQQQRNIQNLINAESIRPHVVELASDKYEGRGAGYSGERKAAKYIVKEFKKIGLKPAGNKGSFIQEFKFHPRHPVKPWEMMTSRNILGLIEGSDPVLKNEIVVIGAHYDGQGKTGQADPSRYRLKSDTATNDDIWNSANDNAASVAAILEIAHAIKKTNIPVKRSILFIAFGAEEHGVGGSTYYVNHPIVPLSNHVAMINMEKIGRLPGKPFNTSGNASSKTWDELLKTIQEQTKTKVTTTNPYTVPESDHYPFNGCAIPSIMFYQTGAPDSHMPSDVSDRINFELVSEAARFVSLALLELANRQERPAFVASPMPDLGLIAHLSTADEAEKMGMSSLQGGLKVTGVIDGLPAALGGLRVGDFITEFANYQFGREESLESLQQKHMEVLSGKRGNQVSVTVVRDGKPVVLQLNLRPPQ